MTIAFDIPYPPTKKGKAAWNKRYGLNAYYSGKCWQQRKRDAEELHTLTILCMKKARIRRQTATNPVELRFLFNDRLDCSNHAVIVKAVEDAMKGWVIKDDNRPHVQRIITEFWDGDTIHVEVREL